MQAPHHKLYSQLRNDFDTIQQSQYLPEDTTKGPDYPGNNMSSIFSVDIERSTHYLKVEKYVQRSQEGSEGSTFIYTLDKTCDSLCFSILHSQLPEIIFKPGYTGNWIPDIALEILRNASFWIDTVEISSFDSISLDLYFELLEKNKQFVRELMGNVPCLTEASSFLPSYSLRMDLPFFPDNENFPFYMFGKLNNFSIKCDFNLMLSSLLKVYDSSGNLVTNLDTTIFHSIDGKAYVEGKQIQTPSILATYTINDPAEIALKKAKAAEEGSSFKIKYRRFEKTEVPNVHQLTGGYNNVIHNFHTSSPIYSIFWVAQNVRSYDMGSTTNYSTNALDRFAGFSPIEHTSLEMNDISLFSRKSYVDTSYTDILRFFGSNPSKNGVNCYSFGMFKEEKFQTPSVKPRKLTLNIQLADTNPYLRKFGSVCEDRFKLFVYCLCAGEITVNNSASEDNSQNQKSSEIIKI